MNRHNIWLLVAVVTFGLLFGIVPALAGLTDDYNHNQDIEFKNTGTDTIGQPLQITYDAAGLVDYGYIQADGEDITIDYLGNEEYITVANLSGTASQWRTERTIIHPNKSVIKTLWFGDALGTRNQAWVAAGSDVATVTSSGSFAFSGTESFSIGAVIVPAIDPGTEQIIFGKGFNYRLSLATGPQLWFSAWDSVTGARSAAKLDVTVGEDTQFIAWFDGGDKSLYCCGTTGCGTASITNFLTSSGSIPHFGEADVVINDFIISTPILPTYSGSVPGFGGGTGTPAAWVRPAGTTYECDTDSCDWDISDYCQGYYPPSDTYGSYFICIDEDMDRLGEGTTHRYGYHPNSTDPEVATPRPAKYMFINLDHSGSLSYYSDDQTLCDVSIVVDFEDLEPNITNPDESNTYLQFYIHNPITGKKRGPSLSTRSGTTPPSFATVWSGSFTSAPGKPNWTIGDLKDCIIGIKIEDHDQEIDTYSCGQCMADSWGYIQDIKVRYRLECP